MRSAEVPYKPSIAPEAIPIEWLAVFVTLVIAGAAVAQACVAYRLLRLQRTIEEDRRRVGVYPHIYKQGRPIILKLMNISPVGVGIKKITFCLRREDMPQKASSSALTASVPIGPYDDAEQDIREHLASRASRLDLPRNERTNLSGEVTVTYIAHGKACETSPVRFTVWFTPANGEFDDLREQPE